MPVPYCPKRGDVVWLTFNPQTGHDQAGHRPALVLSPESYNHKVGLALVCPIRSQVKGYPFEVRLPEGCSVSGVALADQVKSLDWKARRASWCCSLPDDVVHEVLNKLGTLIDD
jgi:mRNA interferase MazF